MTIPGRPRCFTVRWSKVSISVSRQPPNISAGTPTSCSERFPPTLRHGLGFPKQPHRSGGEMAHWLAKRPEVLRVLHPALESDPGHAIWKRDFTGASGLFGVVLKPPSKA